MSTAGVAKPKTSRNVYPPTEAVMSRWRVAAIIPLGIFMNGCSGIPEDPPEYEIVPSARSAEPSTEAGAGTSADTGTEPRAPTQKSGAAESQSEPPKAKTYRGL